MTADEASTTVNKGVVTGYIQQLKTLVHTASSDDIELLRMAVKMPDALKIEREELDEDEWEEIHKHIQLAIKEILQHRTDEAASLEEDFKKENHEHSLVPRRGKIVRSRSNTTRKRTIAKSHQRTKSNNR